MYRDYHIDADSFGAVCPDNWEEVASFMNATIDEKLGSDPDYFDDSTYDGLSAEGREIVNDLWENYSTLPGAPAWEGID